MVLLYMILLKLEPYRLHSFLLELLLEITAARAVITLIWRVPRWKRYAKYVLVGALLKKQNSICPPSCLCFVAVGITPAPLKHMCPYLNDNNTRLLLGTQKTFVE